MLHLSTRRQRNINADEKVEGTDTNIFKVPTVQY